MCSFPFNSVFETTIRYLGGLLSAFELSGSEHQVLVEKAKQLADKMAFAWVGVSYILSLSFDRLSLV